VRSFFLALGLVLSLLSLGGCTATQMMNSLTTTEGYDVATNLLYDQSTGQRLDIYTPKSVKSAPVVVFFHDGRWQGGSKDDFRFVGQALASQGFVAVIPDFRQYPQVKMAGFMGDAARAVVWTHSNIATYSGSPDKIFLLGYSSGAHIAAMLSVDDHYLKDAGGKMSWLRGMIGLAGPYMFMPIVDPTLRDIFGPPEKFQLSQPALLVHGGTPPMLLMHGEDDEIVPVKNARTMAQNVASSGGVAETVIYPKMSHDNIIRVLGPYLRDRNDVLANITDFIHRWENTTPKASVPTGIQTRPLDLDAPNSNGSNGS